MLHYETRGQGAPIILLHAFPLSSQMWKAQLSSLSGKYQVITPDLTGFGKSPGKPGVTMALMAQEVASLLDSLEISGPVLMAGLSMGGYVAFEFLRQYPRRLKGLGLFATRASADTETARENRFKSIEAMERFGLEPFAKKAVKSQLGKTSQEKNPDLVAGVLTLMKENNAGAAIEAQRAMAGRRDSTDLLASIQFPVLIVAGAEDVLCPPEEMRKMHEKISGSEFHVLPESGHLVNLEQPVLFQEIFRAFLAAYF